MVCDSEKDGFRYDEIIFKIFGDCVYTPIDYLSFGFGMFSLILFMFSLTPQLYKTYQRKSVDGISLTMFLCWTFGDISNIIGAILTNQIASVLIIGVFFCINDMFALFQYFYYKNCASPFGPQEEVENLLNNGSNIDDKTSDIDRIVIEQTPKKIKSFLSCLIVMSFCLSAVDAGKSIETPVNSSSAWIGSLFAWFSGSFYFLSRIPQIKTNFEFKSVEGISVLMFIITVCANLSYGLAIILRIPTIDDDFYKTKLPYLIGSMGTLIFDFIILFQSILYKKK
jgi:uncharacterized protein with PQ loop repeat